MVTGFGENSNSASKRYKIPEADAPISKVFESFVGLPGHYSVGVLNVTGILKEVNYKQGYIIVQPSIVGTGDVTRIEYDYPTVISIATGNSVSMRPLRKGDLENIAEESNKKKQKEKKGEN